MSRFALLLALIFSAGCASVPRPAAPAFAGGAPPYDAWARVLTHYVDARGRVDFTGVAANRADLDRFVAYVYDISPNNQPSLFPAAEDVLAYHLNAYNALAMHKVLATGIPQTLAGPRKVSFFLLGKVRVGGERISLYDYENKVIRALGDARVHVGLNCMSVSCPRLPRAPFLPASVNAELDREARLFFNDPRNVQVDAGARVLRLSEILKFFTGDFLREAPSLAAYVNRFRETPVPADYAVQFFPYDWTINRQPDRLQ